MDAIRAHVRRAAISGVLSQLEEPSGRQPLQRRVDQSEWFHSLDTPDRAILSGVVEESVDQALFDLLCVFDGVRLIHEDLREGHLKIVFELDGRETVLAHSHEAFECLHDIYNGEK